MIYTPIVSDGYEWSNTGNSVHALQTFLSLDGIAQGKHWAPVKVYVVRRIKDKLLKRSDFPRLGSYAIVLRKNAIESLEELIRPSAEILPIDTEDSERLFVLNTKTLSNALDESMSILSKFPDGRIMNIVKPYFKTEEIGGSDLFRVRGQGLPTYVSEKFVTAVYRAGLVGLTFKMVWDGRGAV